MPLSTEQFYTTKHIKGIVEIRNLKSDEVYLYASDDCVTSYGKERFKLDLGMHSCASLQDAYTALGLELFCINTVKVATDAESLPDLLEETRKEYQAHGVKLYLS